MTPSLQSLNLARQTLDGQAVLTPLLESPALNEKIGFRLFVKAEMLQKTGSFKFRGAFNAISQLNDEQKSKGVFAYSSGNHAQGIALAAKLLGTHATILMPEDSPTIKKENTRGYGAEVLTYDRYTQSREEIGLQISKEKELTLIKPYDNPDVISGQGTVGLEIVDQLSEQNLKADVITVPCGGGGLTSGISIAIKALSSGTCVYAAEPEGFDDTKRSLESGSRLSNDGNHKSICDAIVTPMPGEVTFPILRQNDVRGLTVSEEDVKEAMRVAFHYFKLVVEPGGAVALAALLSDKMAEKPTVAVAVTSGGNVDPDLYCSILSSK
ncbi:threonine ammonia-lyase [Sneathiella limimaris]|uniref:threonine ammonia-lyase n=1 Tax=Sneathiella limimaris TaxID=1964213 RepID=UPI00146DD260|nr:threonine/serine dehydratase [Sneathiella limimaris]